MKGKVAIEEGKQVDNEASAETQKKARMQDFSQTQARWGLAH
jgi:hypothetical protein